MTPTARLLKSWRRATAGAVLVIVFAGVYLLLRILTPDPAGLLSLLSITFSQSREHGHKDSMEKTSAPTSEGS